MGDLLDGDLGRSPCRTRWADITPELCRKSIDRAELAIAGLSSFVGW
jgi:hypothetical protein